MLIIVLIVLGVVFLLSASNKLINDSFRDNKVHKEETESLELRVDRVIKFVPFYDMKLCIKNKLLKYHKQHSTISSVSNTICISPSSILCSLVLLGDFTGFLDDSNMPFFLLFLWECWLKLIIDGSEL